jgi:hypothetical protein
LEQIYDLSTNRDGTVTTEFTFVSPCSRRAFLRAGSLSLSGLTLADIMAARAAAGTERCDTSVILLYLHGGPSQLETYDLKPDAPIEYRSVFNPIATNVPKTTLCPPMQAPSRIWTRP